MHGKLLIAQGGGPTAVVNASLIAAVREAAASVAVLGVRFGLAGLLKEDIVDLSALPAERLSSIRNSPGAALGSSRCDLRAEDFGRMIAVLRRLDIRRVACIGGNGTMRTALDLVRAAEAEHYELGVAGIPKTIDNDLEGTDFSPGYGSCARCYAQFILDLAADVRSLPTPVSIFEVMGRRVGWLAAATVLACREPDDAPHRVYLPERPTDAGIFLRDVMTAYERYGWAVVAVGEGVGEAMGVVHPTPAGGRHGGAMIGDVAAQLARLVTTELGLRARSEKPGLVARAAMSHVSDFDRQAAELVGREASRRLLAGESGFMAGLRGEPLRVESVPLGEVAARERGLPDSFLGDDGQPNEAFRAYAGRLIGGPLRRHDRLI